MPDYRGLLLATNEQALAVTASERPRARLAALLGAVAVQHDPVHVAALRRRLHLVDPALGAGDPAG